ncbi:hypothetical protein ACQYAD_07285 [Neobacillus sp. SM06]|uniref:hypothetical protein n=1 Tax=Neobacillus sp. SM06 TaxID=3422492 RepID=UPI003D26E7AE
MDKAVIIGAFEFIGFYFCEKMLEMGYEVLGIHFDDQDDKLVEEKKLQIGRNANFSETKIEDWLNDTKQVSEKQIFILDLYDLYIGRRDATFQKQLVATQLAEFFKSRNQLNDTVVFVLPIQCLTVDERNDSIGLLKDFLEKFSAQADICQFLYLPAVYGRWQPSVCCFQKCFEGKHEDVQELDDREWKGDALYADDLIGPMMEIIEEGKPGHYLLESGEANRWKNCAEFLTIQYREDDRFIAREGDQIQRVSLPKNTSIPDSLTKQQEHFNRSRR